jgi:hypothetical protein
VTRLLLGLALAVSLIVPVGGLAMVTAGMAGGASTTSEWDKDELIDDYNQLTRVEEQARPGSAGHIAEARRIAQETLVWAKENDAEPEWEEFAYATSALATLLADGLAGLPSFSETRYDHAVDRINAALAALPPERRPY